MSDFGFLKPRRGRRSTAIANHILLKDGEIFFELPEDGSGSGSGKIVMGDGITAYENLPYYTNYIDIDTYEDTTILTTSEQDLSEDEKAQVRSNIGALSSSSISDKADKVSDATPNNFAGLDEYGNITDSGSKASDFLTSHQDISGKADKVSGATNGNFAGLDSNGNITDSGSKASDFLTSHQDISGKADKVASATNGDLATLDVNGDLTDSGIASSTVMTKVTTAANGNIAQFNASGEVADSSISANNVVTKSQTSGLLKNDGTVDTNTYALNSSLGTAAAKNSTSSVTDSSTDLVESGAVKSAIDAAIAATYKPAGNKAVAELTSALLIASNLGNVYNMTDSGTTTSDFVEGSGKTINAGDNIAIVDIGTGNSHYYKFDILSGMIDLSNYVQKSLTTGLIKNDGSIDTNTYLTSHQDITGKADKVSGATNGNVATLNGSGNPVDSGIASTNIMTKVSGATANRIATLNAAGQVVDSGYLVGQIPVNPSSTAGLNIWIET